MRPAALLVFALAGIGLVVAQPGGGGPGGMQGGPGGMMPGGQQGPGLGMPQQGPGSSGPQQGPTQSGGAACPDGPGVDTVEVSRNATHYTMFFTGCPQYSPTGQKTPNTPTYQNRTVTFRVSPVLSSSPIYVGRLGAGGASNPNLVMGAIGYALNGVPIYNDANGGGEDAVVAEGPTLDSCRAHASPDGAYHYHSEPAPGCVYTDTPGAHSPLYGIMLDSVPLCGALGDGGHPPVDLDECGGYVDSSVPYYHYHTTYNMTAPYTIACLKGCVEGRLGMKDYSAADCSPAAQQHSYASLSIPWTAPFRVAVPGEQVPTGFTSGSMAPKPAQGPGKPQPSTGPQPGVLSKPPAAAKPKPSASPKPASASKPSSAPKPGSTPKPSSIPKPSAAPKPGSTPKPSAAPKPGSTPKPSAAPKPGSTPKPSAAPKPGSTPKPTNPRRMGRT